MTNRIQVTRDPVDKNTFVSFQDLKNRLSWVSQRAPCWSAKPVGDTENVIYVIDGMACKHNQAAHSYFKSAILTDLMVQIIRRLKTETGHFSVKIEQIDAIDITITPYNHTQRKFMSGGGLSLGKDGFTPFKLVGIRIIWPKAGLEPRTRWT